MPPHSTPAEYSGDEVSGAPKMLRPTATGKYSHIQKSPSQVKICTGASCRMVLGILAIESMISAALAVRPRFSPFLRRNGSGSSGGYSFVVTMVQRTAPKNRAAPRRNERRTVGGIALP